MTSIDNNEIFLFNLSYFRAAFMNIALNPHISVDIHGIKVYLKGEFDILPDTNDPLKRVGHHLKVTEFRIRRIDKLNVRIHGLGPLDWVLSKLSTFIGNLLRGHISRLVEGPIKGVLQRMLDNLSIPKITNQIIKKIST